MATNTRKIRISPQIKKAGRTMGYAVNDVLSDYNPTVSNIIKESRSNIKYIKASMSNMKSSNISAVTKDFSKSVGGNSTTNILNDLKRDDTDTNADEDWGVSEEDSQIGAKEILGSVDKMSKLGSNRTAEYIVSSNNRSSKAIYDMTSYGFNQVSTILLDMDSKFDAMLSLGGHVASHVQNSAVFYTNMNKTVSNIDKNLSILVERTAYMDAKKKDSKSRGTGRITDSEGSFSMGGYINLVKENLTEQKENIDLIFGKTDNKDKDKPLMQVAMYKAIEMAIPKFTKEAMKEFNNTLSNTLVGGLHQAGKGLKGSNNIVAQLLGSILFPNDNFKREISTKQYNKGPVPWDGIARKSLVEVIPTYLAKIYASLGGEEKYYDYNIGKFVTNKTMKKQQQYEEAKYAKKAGGKLREEALKKANGNSKIESELEEYFLRAFRDVDNGDYRRIKQNRNNKDYMKKFGLSKESMEILLQLLEIAEVKGGTGSTKSSLASEFLASNTRQNVAYSKYLREQEKSGFSTRNITNNGFETKINEYNQTHNEYLRSIYQMVGNIYGAMVYNKPKRGKLNGAPRNIFNPDTGRWNPVNEVNSKGGSVDNVTIGETYGMSDDEVAAYNEQKKMQKIIKEYTDGKKKNEEFKYGLSDKDTGDQSRLRKFAYKAKSIYETPFVLVTESLNKLNAGINTIFWGTSDKPGLIDKIGESFDKLYDSVKKKISDKFKEIIDKYKNKAKDKVKDKVKKTLGQSIKDEWNYIKESAKNKFEQAKASYGNAKRIMSRGHKMATFTSHGINVESKMVNGEEKYFVKSPQGDLIPIENIDGGYNAFMDNQVNTGKVDINSLLANPKKYEPENLYRGSQVTKTGLAVLSEGELVIPSEFNPYYKKATNKLDQKLKEKRISKSIKGYSTGGTYHTSNSLDGEDVKYYDPEGNEITKEEFHRATGKEKIEQGKKKLRLFGKAAKRFAKKKYKEAKETGTEAYEYGKDKTYEFVGATSEAIENAKQDAAKQEGTIGAIVAGIDTVAGGVSKFITESFFGTEEKMEEDKKKILGKISETFEGLNEGKGAAFIGGVTGAGVSLLTGTLISPIAGALVGAGAGLISRSEKFQEALFGKPDENGNYASSIKNFIVKDFPDIAKYTAVGAVSGKFLGSPIIGAALGATVGFAKRSTKFSNWLFGEEFTAENGKTYQKGGVIPKSLQDMVKKNAPNLAAGILTTMLVSPIKSPIANIILGSAMGYVSTTNEFHEFIFGDGKDNKGLAGTIHDKIVGNLDDIFHNLGNQFKGVFHKVSDEISRLGKSMSKKVRSIAEEKAQNNKFLKAGFNILQKVNPINIAGNVLTGVNNMTQKHNLRKGYDVYDRKLGRNLTAEERAKMREDKNIIRKGAYYNWDKNLADINSLEDLDSLEETIKGIKNNESNFYDNTKSIIDPLTNEFINAGMSTKDTNKLAKYLQSGNKEKAEKLVSKYSPDIQKNVMRLVNGANEKLDKEFMDYYGTNAKAKELIKRGAFGRGANYTTLLDSIENERKLRFTTEQVQAQKEEDFNTNIIGVISHIDRVISKEQNEEPFTVKGEWANHIKAVLKTDRLKSDKEKKQDFYEEMNWDQKTTSRDALLGDMKPQMDMLGNMHYFTKNAQGQIIEDTNEKESTKSRKIMDKFTAGISGLGTLGEKFEGFKGILGSLKDGLLGNKEEGKEGLLSKLFGGLFGDDGMLSGIFGLLSGKKGFGKKLLSGLTSKGMLQGIALPALIVAGITGKLDKIGEIIGKLPFFKGNDTQSGLADNSTKVVKDENGNVRQIAVDENGNIIKDENGNYIDTNGNIIENPDILNIKNTSSNTSISHQLIKNTIAKGTKGVVGTTFKNAGKQWSKAGKAAWKGAKKLGAKAVDIAETGYIKGLYAADNVKSVASKVASKVSSTKTGAAALGMVDNVMIGIRNALEKVPEILQKIPGMKNSKFVTNASTWIDDLLEKIVPFVTKQASKGGKAIGKLVNAAMDLAPALNAIYVVGRGINAWGNAESILGITKKATVGQKMFATMIAVLNALIPFIGDLIPDKTFVNIIVGIGKKLGIKDAEELADQRAAANEEVERFNQENGTDLSIEEYNQMGWEYDEKTGQYKQGKSRAGIITKAKLGVKNAIDKVKEKGLGNTIKDAFGKGVDKANDLTGVKDLMNLANEGKFSEFIKYTAKNSSTNENDKSGIAGLLQEIPIQITKLKLLPSALFGTVKAGIKNLIKNPKDSMDAFKGLIEKGKDKVNDLTGRSDLIKLADEGNLTEFFKYSSIDRTTSDDEKSGILGIVQEMPIQMMKFKLLPRALFGFVKAKIKDIIANPTETVEEVVDGVKNIGSKAKKLGSKALNGIKNVASSIKDKFTGGSSGFVSQYDPRYSNKDISGTTFANKGCGPAVASMTASALGKNLSVDSALNKSKRYQNSAGVSMDYFADVLGSKGINTTYIAGGGAGDLYNSIARGNKVIMLGQDSNNTSKNNSPFGPSNHYVLATGLDRRGNVIVNDPESNAPKTYSPSILKSAKYGISAGGSRRPSRSISYIRLLSGGAGNNAEMIWGFLKKQGFTEQAAAAVMGNIRRECGSDALDPSAIQGGGKGPAAGLCQWENINEKSGRWLNLKKYAHSKGTDWTDLQTQLEFMLSELNGCFNSYTGKVHVYSNGTETWWPEKMTGEQFKKMTDLAKATEIFERVFERASIPAIEERIKYANSYYTMFTGKPGVPITVTTPAGTSNASTSSNGSTSSTGNSTSSTGSESSESSSSSEGGLMGIMSTINNAFSNAFGKIFSNSGSTNSSESDDNQEHQTVDNSVTTSSSTGSAALGTSTGISGSTANNFPYYNQGDSKWGSIAYGKSGTIKSSGCGPSSMAMVLKSYGVNVTPKETAEWSLNNGYRVEGQGTSWDFFKAIGDQNGLQTTQFTDIATAKQNLENNIPVIGSMKPGDFTKGGHFLVFSGINKDGTIVTVNDPGSSARTEKTWNADSALGQAKQFWAISKDGVGSLNSSNENINTGKNGMPSDVPAAAGSGLTIRSYSDMCKSGGSSGLLLKARPSQMNANVRNASKSLGEARKYYGGDSSLATDATQLLTNLRNTTNLGSKSGSISPETVTKLLESITKLLNNISNNTAPVEKIYNVLTQYLSKSGGDSDLPKTTKPKGNSSTGDHSRIASGEVDQSIQSLAGVLAELAKG